MKEKDYKSIDRKIDLFHYKNNIIKYSEKVQYQEIDLYKFFKLVFSRDNELPFEDKKVEGKDYTKGKYNAICVEIGAYTKKIKDKDTEEEKEVSCSKNYIITNDLEVLDDFYEADFVISSPITYIGRTRNSNNARNCYGLAFDVDGVEEQQIEDIIHQMKTGFIPTANIIVNSGNGVHLYYLFEKPISLFDNIKYLLKDFKYQLTDIIWNSYTSRIKIKQFQGIFQGFRLPDTKTKFGEKVQAFATDRKYYSISELNNYIKDPKKKLKDEEIQTIENAIYKRKKLSLKEAKEKYPDWYERRIVKGQKKGVWNIKRDLYDWWLRKCYSEEIQEGHRYFTLMALSMYALKCNISEKELFEDAYKLLDKMESLTTNEDNHFTEEDIKDSLAAFKENYRTFPRKDIEKLTGVSIPANKRNGLNHLQHIKKMNLIRDNITHLDKEWRNKEGRPKGAKDKKPRKTKKEIIQKWKLENPNGNKFKCEKELGISRHTVLKWWE